MDHNIIFKNVSYTYGFASPFATSALNNVSFEIPANQVTAIIGHTGSGKSTIIQHLNALLRPSEGSVAIFDEVITSNSKHKNLKALRKKVGVVFQFPEAQLFEETVIKDVMFGPMNFGVAKEEAKRIAEEKLALVGIDSDLFERSPFDLSGGQMRRVAIAGVLALEPEVLVLDEPTAGLDPLGHETMMNMFMSLKKEVNLTLIMVTHQMEDVAEYADHVIVLDNGTIAKVGSVKEVFSNTQWAMAKNLGLPHAMKYYDDILQKVSVNATLFQEEYPINVKELAQKLVALKKHLSFSIGGGDDE